jgi:hypothetical protein
VFGRPSTTQRLPSATAEWQEAGATLSLEAGVGEGRLTTQLGQPCARQKGLLSLRGARPAEQTVTVWQPVMCPYTAFEPGKAISGGIPVIFP